MRFASKVFLGGIATLSIVDGAVVVVDCIEVARTVTVRLRPTLAKPTLAILIFRLWPNPTLAKPTLARKI